MNKVPIHTLFDIKYGNSLHLDMLEVCDANFEEKINYVSRTRENNGISATVKRIQTIQPFEAGLITVAGSGNSVLETFVQPEPFYTGFHVFILKPKKALTDVEKLFYAYCIRQNQYKYNFGRQANKTLKDIVVPLEIPAEFKKIVSENAIKISKEKQIKEDCSLEISNWDWLLITDIFTIFKGADISSKHEKGKIHLVSATKENNGISNLIADGKKLFKKNTITVPSNGASTGEAFYQEKPYFATGDVNVLEPKFELNKYIALFIITIIRLDKYRFSYGRKWGKDRMLESKIKLPVDKNGIPNWQFMEKCIKSLPYSKNI